MPIAEGASLVGGAALGAPFSEILKLLIEWVKKVKDFKPLSQDLTSTMGRMVPLFNEINLMQPGTCTGELKYLINTMQRAEELLRKCSNVQWYSIIDRALYSKEIEKIHEDFFRFCQMELQLIQLRNQHVQYREQVEYMRSLETKIDLLSVTGKESSELFRVPLPEEVTVCWLLRPVRKLKKMLFEDGVVSVVVSAPSACGKTSLVTKLCHDADVKGKFNHILFVTVSKAPNIRLTLQMLHVHTGCTANEFPSDFDASLCIEQALMQLSQTGPVLLVLDDVWPEEESFLEKFLIHLPDYKILVTSRFEFPNFGPTFHLEPFIDEDVKNIFLKSAPDPNCASCSKLGHSLQKVLKHCNGFPLATNNPCREASGDLGCPSDTSEFSGSAQKQNKGKRRDEDEPETPKEHLVKSENIRKEPLVQTTSNGNKADSSPSDTSEFSGSAQKPDKGKRRDEDETETPIEHSGKMAEVRKETFVQTKSNGTKAGSSPRPVFDEPPTDFICPISREIMQDPHIAADGFTYEAETIRTWLRGGAQRSPITNARLADQHLIPNYTLRSMIGDWLQQHPNYNVD